MRFGSGSLVILVLALFGLLLFFTAARRLRRRQLLAGTAHGAMGLILILLCAAAALITVNLSSYQRLNFEQAAGELQLQRTADHQFDAVLSYPDGKRDRFTLRGDEWQIDARVLKWRAFANLLGFDALYRLQRIGGRYANIDDERSQPRTVYELSAATRIDPWELAHRYHRWIPSVDALYGSAVYLPMADGALYEIRVSQSGLVARPLNQAARDAVASWH